MKKTNKPATATAKPDSAAPITVSPAARSLWCYAFISSCQPHLDLQQIEMEQDFSAWNKLLSKLKAFLTGELKSESNLLRFYEAFCQWHEQSTAGDNINSEITELCAAATRSAVDALFDPECDDHLLIDQSVTDIHQQIKEMGGAGDELNQYWSELKSEWWELLQAVKQRPVSPSLLKTLSAEVSPFGLEQ